MPPWHSHEPIALDELDALQDRVDVKYVISTATFAALAAQLRASHRVLEIGGRREFTYRTTYFDTPDLQVFRDHQQRRRRRYKARSREYVDTGARMFEVKLKGARGRTVKHRMPYDRAGLSAPALDFLHETVRREYGRSPDPGLRSALDVVYRRVTFAAPGERLTCDFDLRFGGGARLAPDRVIVESKSAHGNAAADRILRALGERPEEGCSKYCLGVALTDPRAKRNGLRRLLRKHFLVAALAVPVLAPATAQAELPVLKIQAPRVIPNEQQGAGHAADAGLSRADRDRDPRPVLPAVPEEVVRARAARRARRRPQGGAARAARRRRLGALRALQRQDADAQRAGLRDRALVRPLRAAHALRRAAPQRPLPRHLRADREGRARRRAGRRRGAGRVHVRRSRRARRTLVPAGRCASARSCGRTRSAATCRAPRPTGSRRRYAPPSARSTAAARGGRTSTRRARSTSCSSRSCSRTRTRSTPARSWRCATTASCTSAPSGTSTSPPATPAAGARACSRAGSSSAATGPAGCSRTPLRAGPGRPLAGAARRRACSENLHAAIDANVRELRGELNRNFTRWPVLHRRIWPNGAARGSHSAEVRHLRSWLDRRIAWIDRNVR